MWNFYFTVTNFDAFFKGYQNDFYITIDFIYLLIDYRPYYNDYLASNLRNGFVYSSPKNVKPYVGEYITVSAKS